MYSPLYHNEYDLIYAFSLFDFTPKNGVTDDMIKGGTGFDVESRLPPEIEAADYDWSMYPNCNYSVVWFSRGCIRNCGFCIVRQKEGYIRSVQPKNLNPNGEFVRVQDNNFLANPKWRESIEWLKNNNQYVQIDGLDIRLLTDESAEALSTLKFKHSALKFAWDNPKENIDEYVELLTKYMKPYKMRCYVLIGYNSNKFEDYWRVTHIWNKFKVMPFVMPYNKFDPYQRDFSIWVNRNITFKKVSWFDFDRNVKNKWLTEDEWREWCNEL